MNVPVRIAALAAGVFPAIAASAQEMPQTVTIAPAVHSYRPAGEFVMAGKSAAPGKRTVTFDRPLVIMKYQVTEGEYAMCVTHGACSPAFGGGGNAADRPVTGVSLVDATAYATWLSGRTGGNWRLPTDMEWSFAAAERFAGEPFDAPADGDSPAAAWIASYESMARNAGRRDPQVHPRGTFGGNANGVFDMAGNVWEWTSTCYVRAKIASDGGVLAEAENCGVRVVEGRHRSYMTYFVQDAASGGCAVGAAPDHLGFRLVRDPPTLRRWLAGALSRLFE